MPRPAVAIPAGLEWWRGEPGGPEWLDRLPAIVGERAEIWSLRVGEAFPDSHVSWVAPVELPFWERAVLKINFPERESEHESSALAHWRGEGAVRCHLFDPERRALVVEHCDPGTPLWTLTDEREANRIAAAVLRRLWRRVPDDPRFRLLADVAAHWVEELPERWERLGRPYERPLLDEAVSFLREAGRRRAGRS